MDLKIGETETHEFLAGLNIIISILGINWNSFSYFRNRFFQLLFKLSLYQRIKKYSIKWAHPPRKTPRYGDFSNYLLCQDLLGGSFFANNLQIYNFALMWLSVSHVTVKSRLYSSSICIYWVYMYIYICREKDIYFQALFVSV